jgi:hypothetical protein
MAQRTYTPTLRVITWALKKFCDRYAVKLEENLSPEVYALLLILLDAADDLLIALGEAPINP